MASVSAETPASHGHSFSKKTFHKPTYCHSCTDMLWGLIQQGYICEVCNFVVHDRCLKAVVSPCSSIAASLIKNPVAHCWSEQEQVRRRKFCNVCRKRLDDSLSIHCEICEYFVHTECQDFAVADCKENATFLPGKDLSQVKHTHLWREGNLPSSSKCAVCKKNCFSAECLSGFRCEWCGMTVKYFSSNHHPSGNSRVSIYDGFKKYLHTEYSILEKIVYIYTRTARHATWRARTPADAREHSYRQSYGQVT